MSIPRSIHRPRPIPLFGRPFLTLLGKEVHRFMTVVVQTIITPLVTAGLYLTIFVGGLSGKLDGLQGVRYIDYLVPGLAMMGAMNHSFNNAASSFMISKFQNNLVDILVTPLTDLEIACAYGFASVLRGMLVGFLTWMVTLPFGGPVPQHPFWAVSILCFGSMAFAFLGVGAGVFGTKFDDIARISTFIILPLTYLGAVFIPITRYPENFQPILSMNPMLYTIDGFRMSFLGESYVRPWEVVLVVSGGLALTLGFSLVALRFSRAIRN